MSLSRMVLPSGRSVDLTEIRMSSTYAGFLEGYPCRAANEMVVRGLQWQAEQAFPGTPTHLVPPRLTYRDEDRGEPPTAFGPVVELPPVACVGLFRSTVIAPALDPVLHRSSLAVVWFQTPLSVPTDESAAPGLHDLNWDELAGDYEL
ncbi:hypothetical protein [Streptomyces sp. NPDC085659]|uniref:hypothetical protein n=2 Tax=Streptomyces TaxID=1883 RepID=UPI00344FC602